MAGFGKNQRMGKRSSAGASTSSPLYYVTIVIFVAFCGLGIWMLTSSPIIPSHATSAAAAAERRSWASSSKVVTSSRASRVVAYRDPPQTMDDTQGDLPEDAIKGDGEEEEEEKRDTKLRSAVDKLEKRSAQQEEEQSGGSVEGAKEEEGRRQEQQEGIGENENQEESTGESKREEEAGSEGGQQRDSIMEGGAEDNNNNNSQEQQSEDIHERHQREHDEQMPGGDVDERQQDSQQQQQQQQEEEQQRESSNDENQEKTEEVIHEDSDSKFDEKIQEVTDENQNQSVGGSEEGGNDSRQNEETEGNREEGDQKPSEHKTEEANHAANGEEGRQGENEEKLSDPNAAESLPDSTPTEVSNESDGEKRPWATQADQSDNEKERRKDEELQSNNDGDTGGNNANLLAYEWKLCNVTAGPDYIPCLDNIKAIKKLHSLRHYEHRERHCPEESPTCLVSLPDGYKRSIEWPTSRDKIWYNNVPRTKLAEVKGHQNWVKVSGEFLTFPGGGTQFIHGALHYIDFIQQSVRDIAWGKHTRVILDVGCGVASFGGYLFERDVLAMSFAPKDEHEAQVQFALERGIPAISAVMGSQRLPFPSKVFDIVHCARCRVPWHADGGALLLELNRVLRPGGYFVWSATPVYQKLKEDVEIWSAMKVLTGNMCWDLVTIKKDKLNGVGAAFFRKPTNNDCYQNRKHHNPPMCNEDDDPNAAWYIPLKACMHQVPVDASERGTRWPEQWPNRLQVPPYWLNSSQTGIYGKQAPEDFAADYQHWKRVVSKSYLNGLGINWSRARNIMDMRAVYGGFAAALRDMKVWVMNVVNIDDPDTLPIIYERGFFGIYHDWCESFSTYPRTYDLLHADHLFSRIKKRCDIVPVIAEVDRIVRPGGSLIVRDDSATISEVENLLKSLHWEVRLTFSKDQEGILSAEKSDWRPQDFADSS